MQIKRKGGVSNRRAARAQRERSTRRSYSGSNDRTKNWHVAERQQRHPWRGSVKRVQQSQLQNNRPTANQNRV